MNKNPGCCSFSSIYVVSMSKYLNITNPDKKFGVIQVMVV